MKHIFTMDSGCKHDWISIWIDYLIKGGRKRRSVYIRLFDDEIRMYDYELNMKHIFKAEWGWCTN